MFAGGWRNWPRYIVEPQTLKIRVIVSERLLEQLGPAIVIYLSRLRSPTCSPSSRELLALGMRLSFETSCLFTRKSFPFFSSFAFFFLP